MALAPNSPVLLLCSHQKVHFSQLSDPAAPMQSHNNHKEMINYPYLDYPWSLKKVKHFSYGLTTGMGRLVFVCEHYRELRLSDRKIHL